MSSNDTITGRHGPYTIRALPPYWCEIGGCLRIALYTVTHLDHRSKDEDREMINQPVCELHASGFARRGDERNVE